jgi:hypothetical protein
VATEGVFNMGITPVQHVRARTSDTMKGRQTALNASLVLLTELREVIVTTDRKLKPRHVPH